MMIKPVQVICFDPFGRAVAADLVTLRTDCITTIMTENIAVPARPRLRVIIASRPVPNVWNFLDEASHDSRCSFLPLTADGATLRLGPVVIPGQGSCWSCWTKRERQHDPWADRRDALVQYYEAHPRDGPKGYLRPFTLMGAVRLSAAIDELDAGSALGGYFWQIDMITREIVTGRAVGVDDCARCGLRRPSATRSVAEMKDALRHLWVKGGIDGQ
jgi:bacteriocin biosynthesis cyclodehydratase domain-containing protein